MFIYIKWNYSILFIKQTILYKEINERLILKPIVKEIYITHIINHGIN